MSWSLFCAPAGLSACIDSVHVDRRMLLGFIPQLACFSKEWNAAMRSRVEYAALHDATSLHRNRVANSNWLRQRGGNPLAEFDSTMAIFTKSSSFTDLLPIRLWIAPLGDLSNPKLCSLLAFLKSGWMAKVFVIPGDGQELLETIWVTPTYRAKHS